MLDEQLLNSHASGLKTEITVGVCTYGRPHLRDTLMSLIQQILPPKLSLKIVVADNSTPPSASEIVEDVRRHTDISIVHVLAPPYNISTARNVILNQCTTKWLAFIDDDELATQSWIAELFDQACSTSGDAVFGPVQALYDSKTPTWIIKGDFHSTDITFVSGQIITGYTCNVLMNLSSHCYRNLQFAPELGETGGEDTLFFSTLHKRGARLSYAPNALIYEPVPLERASFGWLFKRRFRSGQTHARTLMLNSQTSNAKAALFAGVKGIFCIIAAMLVFISPVQSRRWMLRGALHFGVVGSLLGKKDLALYKTPE